MWAGISARLEAAANYFILLTGRRRLMAAFLAGLVSALSLAPLYLFFVLFFTFPIFVWILDGVHGDSHGGWLGKLLAGFWPGWWFGFGYFLSGLWWVGSAFIVEAEDFLWALPFAVIGLPGFLAIFWGIAAAIARLFWHDHWTRVFVFAAGFAVLEFFRGTVLTGFPWNAPGHALMTSIVPMQAVSLVGLYAMTLLAFVLFAIPLIVAAIPAQYRVRKIIPLALVVLVFLAQFGFGFWRLASNQTDYVDGVNLRLMQPAIDQKAKFDPAKESEIIETYLSVSATLSGEDESRLANTTYLIWPESAFPFLLTERRDVLSAIGELLPDGVQLITGAMRAEPGAAGDPYGKVYNSVYLIGDNGEIISAADKTHLVPFGEYLPFQSFLESLGLQQLTRLRGGFANGTERVAIQGAKGPAFLPLICYEVIFPGKILPPNAPPKSIGWLVNLTNDAWFGLTPGPYQHLHQTIVRAVEEGLPIVRVANSGISAVIDPYGRRKAVLGLGERGIVESALPKPSDQTFFSAMGNLIFQILTLLAFLIGFGGRFVRNHA